SSLDQIGPIASSAEDCAILLNEIAGFDPHDGTSAKKPKQDYTSKIGKPVKGLKIALPKEFFGDGIDDDVRQAVLNAAKAYEDMGAKLVEVSLPALEYAISAYYLIASAEASSNLSRYDGIKFGYRTAEAQNYEQLIRKSRTEGFGDEVKRRILLGTYALCSGYYDAYYKKALAVRQELKRQYAEIFENCDVMLTPTAPSTAYGIDENIDNPVKMYLADICTVTVNIAGLPAISTTCGYGSNGMPIGMSIVGKAFDDAAVVQFADAFERSFEVKPPNMQH
ncbi:MAG TPA: Asp-tRNA(Asn)/Glu-tRNA(Gln) amidotransferase subunit GatA, partial [Ruminococcaceae bacterium]|nr:Asp-tRNA(Asn)/Glu-tRNA(Gln) amidotransferase subunit GatA [Oscillospiraceae bacterium]